MSEEVKKDLSKPEETSLPVAEKTTKSEAKEEREEVAAFSFDSSNEELPEEIKQNHEMRTVARAKKEVINQKRNTPRARLKHGRLVRPPLQRKSLIRLAQ